MLMMIFTLAVFFLVLAGFWKTFEKAGKPGWACLIPIYNVFVLLNIARRPAWWFVLLLIPFVNIIVALMIAIDVARNFGKGTGFGLGLFLFGFVFYPILGFSDARYSG
jgi:hypothetical protein